MTSVHVRGMAIDSEGEGPPIVMLHGLGGTSNSFQAMVPALTGFRVVRPDLPGAGRSPTPAQKITVGLLVEAVAHAADHLGVNRAHVVGHSFGTLIAQHVAARHPDRVASLTLFGPILEPQDAARERLLARAAGLLGQLAEEQRNPIANDIYMHVDRNAVYVPPKSE